MRPETEREFRATRQTAIDRLLVTDMTAGRLAPELAFLMPSDRVEAARQVAADAARLDLARAVARAAEEDPMPPSVANQRDARLESGARLLADRAGPAPRPALRALLALAVADRWHANLGQRDEDFPALELRPYGSADHKASYRIQDRLLTLNLNAPALGKDELDRATVPHELTHVLEGLTAHRSWRLRSALAEGDPRQAWEYHRPVATVRLHPQRAGHLAVSWATPQLPAVAGGDVARYHGDPAELIPHVEQMSLRALSADRQMTAQVRQRESRLNPKVVDYVIEMLTRAGERLDTAGWLQKTLSAADDDGPLAFRLDRDGAAVARQMAGIVSSLRDLDDAAQTTAWFDEPGGAASSHAGRLADAVLQANTAIKDRRGAASGLWQLETLAQALRATLAMFQAQAPAHPLPIDAPLPGRQDHQRAEANPLSVLERVMPADHAGIAASIDDIRAKHQGEVEGLGQALRDAARSGQSPDDAMLARIGTLVTRLALSANGIELAPGEGPDPALVPRVYVLPDDLPTRLEHVEGLNLAGGQLRESAFAGATWQLALHPALFGQPQAIGRELRRLAFEPAMVMAMTLADNPHWKVVGGVGPLGTGATALAALSKYEKRSDDFIHAHRSSLPTALRAVGSGPLALATDREYHEGLRPQLVAESQGGGPDAEAAARLVMAKDHARWKLPRVALERAFVGPEEAG